MKRARLIGPGHRVLAGGVAAGLAAADDAAVAVGELAQQVEVFVVDVHRPRRDALDVDRIALGDLLDVLIALVSVVAVLDCREAWCSGRENAGCGMAFEIGILNFSRFAAVAKSRRIGGLSSCT